MICIFIVKIIVNTRSFERYVQNKFEFVDF